jgi:anti-sigma regulatory factor (Ser/Thr protein kinase)
VPETIRIEIEESSKTAEVRRVARKLASDIGLDESAVERVAIGVTEVCTNILKHAVRGSVLLRVTENGNLALEVLALDKGPGMTNLEQCLRDGFSTGGSAGQGLGAIMRLSTASDFYTVPGQGTAVLAKWSTQEAKPPSTNGPGCRNPRKLSVGAVNVCKPGQLVCGDAWGVEQNERESVLMVADGLGHGPEAKAASIEAVRMLHLNPELPPMALIERAHRALRSSRGAAVAVARVDREAGKVTFAGIGNISAHIYSSARTGQHLVSVNGTAGHETQRLHEFSYPWPADGTLVLHSDGLSSATNLESRPGLASRDPTLIAGVLYRDFCRGNDDATVVVAQVFKQ